MIVLMMVVLVSCEKENTKEKIFDPETFIGAWDYCPQLPGGFLRITVSPGVIVTKMERGYKDGLGVIQYSSTERLLVGTTTLQGETLQFTATSSREGDSYEMSCTLDAAGNLKGFWIYRNNNYIETGEYIFKKQ